MDGLLNELTNLTLEYTKNIINHIDTIIKDLDDNLRKCAKEGYTTYLIQFTRNEEYVIEDHTSTVSTVIRVNNDAVRNRVSEAITKHYEELGLNVSKRYGSSDDLLISWNKNVLDHYGYEF